jgi:hypothetical protein
MPPRFCSVYWIITKDAKLRKECIEALESTYGNGIYSDEDFSEESLEKFKQQIPNCRIFPVLYLLDNDSEERKFWKCNDSVKEVISRKSGQTIQDFVNSLD